MAEPKSVSGWMYWLLLYFIACIPAAVFAGIMASSYVYTYNHYHHIANYF